MQKIILTLAGLVLSLSAMAQAPCPTLTNDVSVSRHLVRWDAAAHLYFGLTVPVGRELQIDQQLSRAGNEYGGTYDKFDEWLPVLRQQTMDRTFKEVSVSEEIILPSTLFQGNQDYIYTFRIRWRFKIAECFTPYQEKKFLVKAGKFEEI